MFKKAAVLVASCGALLSGCGTDVQSENEQIIANLELKRVLPRRIELRPVRRFCRIVNAYDIAVSDFGHV